MSILYNDLVIILIVSTTVGFIVYFWFDKIFDKGKDKILSNRTEILRLLELMFIDADIKKINWILFLSSFGLGTVVFLLLLPHFIIGFALALLVGFAGWKMPLFLVKSMFDKRCSHFVEQMVDGLTMMANGVKSGLGLVQSMQRVTDNMGNPLSQEFKLVISQTQMGRSLEEALTELAVRIPKPDVQVFVTAVNILKETGGNLAENFTTIVFTIRERQKVEKKIEAMTAQGLMQGLIVSMVPIILIGVFWVVDPGYIKPMFTTPLGLVLIFIMFALIIVGGITIKKIVTIKV